MHAKHVISYAILFRTKTPSSASCPTLNSEMWPGRTRSVSNANRRRLEDNLAVIFMAIVLFFLISHFPRIILGLQGRKCSSTRGGV